MSDEASYLSQVNNIRDWLLEHRTDLELASFHARLILDVVSDQDDLRAAAKEVLDHDWVDGDSYGIPSDLDIVIELVNEVTRLRYEATGRAPKVPEVGST